MATMTNWTHHAQEPVTLGRVNGHEIHAVYVVSGAPGLTFNSLGEAMRHADGIPAGPYGRSPVDPMPEGGSAA